MIKKWLTLILCLAVVPVCLFADNYNSLWLSYEAAKEQDLPKTQIEVLDKIIQKASTEKAYGHLLKAELLRVKSLTDISPDSLHSAVSKLEEQEQKARQTDAVLAAIYQTALGKIYQYNHGEDGNNQQKAAEYFRLAMANPEQLALHKAAEYRPFIEIETDSKWFDYDLLHVIGIETGNYAAMSRYYNTTRLRTAACLSALYLAKKQCKASEKKMCKSSFIRTIDSLLTVYGDIPIAGEIAIARYEFMEKAHDVKVEEKIRYINHALSKWGEWIHMNRLRNELKELTQPSFTVEIGTKKGLPNQPRTFRVKNLRNIGELTMKITRIGIDGSKEYDIDDDKVYAELKKKAMPTNRITQTKRYVGQPDYKLQEDSFLIPALPEGIYLVEFSTNNKDINETRDLLYISNLHVISEQLPGKRIRYAVVNATTGQPIKGANLRLTWTEGYYDEKKSKTVTTNEKGEYIFLYNKTKPEEVWPSTIKDVYCPNSSLWNSFYYSKYEQNIISGELFTDRAIYRPGQQVEVSLMLLNRHPNHQMEVIANEKATIELRDANYKIIEKQEVTTNAYGTASCRFKLPVSGLNGRYTLRVDNRASTSFLVEEYKRPTFVIELPQVNEKYTVGDTVVVKGRAKTYSGVPVQGAKVAYRVVRKERYGWRRYAETFSAASEVMNGEAVTDAEGGFDVELPMVLPDEDEEAESYYKIPRFYQFVAEVDVTDVGGETQHGELSLPLGTKPTMLVCNLPDKIERDSLKTIMFEWKNAAGNPIAGTVKYTINGLLHTYTARTNEAVEWPDALRNSLKTGKYHLKAVCGQDTIEQDFIVFTLSDKRPCIKTKDWFYITANQFPSNDKPIYVQVGASDPDTHIFYSIIAGNRLLESGVTELDNAINTRRLVYKEEYGDGLLLTYAWVKDGKMYSHNVQIAKPMPDKRLLLTWKTFRDRLTPGQKEEWTLSVKYPDGKPATAQLMAVLFDKSLNQIAPHNWNINFSLSPSIASGGWEGLKWPALTTESYAHIKYLASRDFLFSRFDMELPVYYPYTQSYALASKLTPMKVRGAASMKKEADEAELEKEVETVNVEMAANDSPAEEPVQKGGSQLRENLNETAFFFPALQTNDKGEVLLKFTLPESITTWQFMGLAHDQQVNHGLMKSEAIAQKEVMIQPNMPRFLRKGDKAMITAKLLNTSEKAVSGTAIMELLNPETEKMEYRKLIPFNIQAGETGSVSFDFSPTGDIPLYICRVTATGKTFSDGEQHYLPILPDRELVTNTYPFTQHQAGKQTIDLTKLFAVNEMTNKLTIEYTNNPAWLMIQTLPTYAVSESDNVIAQATSYYVNAIAANILRQSPEIKTVIDQWRSEEGKETSLMSAMEKNQELKNVLLEETPWVNDAEKEASQKRSLVKFFDETTLDIRLTTAIKKLNELQNPNGSWSWWKGMRGNIHITTAVSETLVRLNKMTGVQKETQKMLDQAFAFMSSYLIEEYNEMKKEEQQGKKHFRPSETVIRILYISALDGRNLSSKANTARTYMIDLLSKKTTEMTIYGKATAALILAKDGRREKAATYLKSIEEYTVTSKEMGRYFDTPKAQYSWFDYRIPTQVAAIEAFKELKPSDKQTIDEMQRWLLQEKRTQSWDTPINSVNAVYAFLDNRMDKLETHAPTVLSVNGQALDIPQATAGLGYVKTSMTGKDMKTFTANKTSEGTSWGVVYAQFMQKVSDIEAGTSGITVTREIIGGHRPLKVGDRVKIRITIKAERDYDFVQVIDKRAACLEPIGQLSGYRWGYYISPKDYTTNYYFDQMRKGTHQIETEYYVDRIGSYESGTCTVQCAYAPEYTSRARAMVLEVE